MTYLSTIIKSVLPFFCKVNELIRNTNIARLELLLQTSYCRRRDNSCHS